jgi:catechol 2,3-dioxygenase-like lactoylglutathione lyase family enzyme
VPIDLVKLPVADLAASRHFYRAAVAPFGWKLVYDGGSSPGFGTGDGGEHTEPFAVEVVDASWPASHIAIL